MAAYELPDTADATGTLPINQRYPDKADYNSSWAWSSPYLSKGLNKKRAKMQDRLEMPDTEQLRQAVQMAIDIHAPTRWKLYELYKKMYKFDDHLRALADGRVRRVSGQKYGIRHRITGEDAPPEIAAQFRGSWVRKLFSQLVQTKFYGYSVLHFINRASVQAGGFPQLVLLDRDHVRPETNEFLPYAWSTKGLPLRLFKDQVIECGFGEEPRTELGLFLPCAVAHIRKQFSYLDWEEMSESYHMLRFIFFTDTTNYKTLQKYRGIAEEYDTDGSAVLNKDDKVEQKESTRTDPHRIYEHKIDRAEKGMSKLIMGLEWAGGANYKESQMHMLLHDDVLNEDKADIAMIFNERLMPMIPRWREYELYWIHEEPQSQHERAQMIAQMSSVQLRPTIKSVNKYFDMEFESTPEPKAETEPEPITDPNNAQ